MIFDNLPYTNFHELNLDWVIRKIKELEALLKDGLTEELKKLISKLFVNIVYDEENETIILDLEMGE